MPWTAIATGVLSVLNTLTGGIFQSKQAKAEVIASGIGHALEAFKAHNMTERERLLAITSTIQAEINSNSFLSGWRQLVMMSIFILIACYFFGYTPPHIEQPMGPMMTELFGLLKIGIMGYIPARTADKAIASYQGRKLVEKVLEKVMEKL